MELSLEPRSRTLWVAGAVLTLSIAYVALVTTHFISSVFANVHDEAHLTRAARLEPGNAEYAARLGSFESTVHQSPQPALPWLESATKLNPYKAKYWVELALAQQSVGDEHAEMQDLKMAMAMAPTNPEITWAAANLFLAQGSTDEAMRGFRLVMEN